MHVIAVDCAGHGGSSFRSADSGYNIWQDIAEILGVADQMGWEQFALLGHSRGAIISTLIAGAFPTRISHAALIDGYMPGLADAKGTAIQMAKSVYEAKRFGAASPSFFPDFDRAVQARVNGFIPLKEGAATVLAQRGVRQHERGFYWHTDQRLKAASQIKLTREHMQDFFSSVTAPVMLIQAEDSGFKPDAQQDEAFSWITNFRLLKMPGSHHLHMEEQAEQVAEEVQKFILP
jgi:pimeloyl-ACP methyl ester carboxylesterase